MEWQKDNEFILSSYRKASYSLDRSLKSIWSIHNETVNIWSHLLGAGAWLFLLIQVLLSVDWFQRQREGLAAPPTGDLVALALYYAGVVMTFASSTLFHTFANHSAELHERGNALDHLGIVVVMWASSVCSDYFGFYHEPWLRNVYCVMVTLSRSWRI